MSKKESTPKKITARQVLAFVGIGLLVALYLITLIFALIQAPWAKNLLIISLVATFVIPVIIYIITMFYKLAHRDEPQYIEVPVEAESPADETTAENDIVQEDKA